MADPRVQRGSTYSLYRKVPNAQSGGLPAAPGATAVADPAKVESADSKARKKRAWREKSIYDYRPPTNLKGEIDL